MRRSAGVGLFLIFLLGLALSGCGGKGTPTTIKAVPATVTLSPSSISMEKGAVFQVSVAVLDKDGKSVLTQTPIFTSSNTAVLTVSKGGLLCAGTWDSLTTPIVCTPATTNGTSNLTATAGSITSNTVVVSVHDHVDNITVSPASVDCKSQAGTQVFTATAFHSGVDITALVGAFTWAVPDGTVAKVTTAGPSTSPALNANQALITAVNPGRTNIAAFASGTNSSATFTTCAPTTISIDLPTPTAPDTATSFSIAKAATKQLESHVVDILGTTITALSLTWSSSQPAVATVSTSGLVTGVAPGVALITASCTPPSCNPGVNQPVYSNPVTATITGTSLATTVYATSSVAPASGGHTDLIPISTDTNTAGTAIALTTDAAINSLLISPTGTTAYLGSSKGLLIVDLASNKVTSTLASFPGKVLAISPNGQFIVTSDSGAGKVYVYDSANNPPPNPLPIPGATHASFTTDSLKGYITAGSTLYQYSISFIPRTIAMSAVANDVAVNTTGQFAYTAGGEVAAVAARDTCRNDTTWAPEDSVPTGASPDLIASASTGDLLAVEGASSEMDKITPAIGAPPAGTSCPPSLSDSLVTADWTGLGIASFTPRQLFVTPNGAKAYITSDQTVLLGYDVAGNTTFTVAVGGANTFTGGALIDSTKVYVGGSDSAVHVIDVATGTQSATISLSFVPDLVAVRPH